MVSTLDVEEASSSSDTETTAAVSDLSTPLTQSGRTSPTSIDAEGTTEAATAPQKKKRKKKPKKASKSKDSSSKPNDGPNNVGRPPVLCISRNKHWKYISSYHGPWLQLPLELLDTLFTLNVDPTAITASEMRPLLPSPSGIMFGKQRDRSLHNLGDFTPPDSPRTPHTSLPLPPPQFSMPKAGKLTPPPIDPGVFRSIKDIRRLIDEASELAVRASSGLSSAELGSMRSGSGMNGSPWASAQSLGINPLGNTNGGGRNVGMSAIRIHRLRVLAIQKLAQAYKSDEIASSVMVMQGGSVFDDLAERVLKFDPNDADAKYVHFFHEKIPSRQLAESTTTFVLDELIAAYPQRLEYYRTRGIVHCFREDFPQATRDFTFALKEARAIRKANSSHHDNLSQNDSRPSKQGKRRKGSSSSKTNGQAPPDGTSVMEDGLDSSEPDPFSRHPSSLNDALNPIEPQLLFLRGAAYLQQAIYSIEGAVLELEDVVKAPSMDGAELRLCYLENGKYGGVEIGNPDGPLGKSDGAKVQAYAAALGDKMKEHVIFLLKRSIRDHEKFLSHFDSLESPDAIPDGDIAFQTQYAFFLSESYRRSNQSNAVPPLMDPPGIFTTYHPLLIESLFSVLICQLMLGDFSTLLRTFVRTSVIVDGLEGYPVFMPPRSMAQAEFIEVLERLAGGWRNGILPHSLSGQRGKSRLAIEPAPPISPTVARAPAAVLPSPPASRSNSYHDTDNGHGAGSSSSSRQNTETFDTHDASGVNGFQDQQQQHPFNEEPRQQKRADAIHALDCARMLLAPVVKRQKDRAQKEATEKATSAPNPKPLGPISIPLHGPRVEVILAWLAAIHLPELDT